MFLDHIDILGESLHQAVQQRTMHRTQDAGDEKCYADFARGGESHATERPPWERVQRGHRSQVVEQSTSETKHAQAQTTASATASAAILSEAPKEAAGASSSVLKGMGTWVFEVRI